MAAEALLTQAIANLLTNAVKFVPPGIKPCIRIWSEAIAADRAPSSASSTVAAPVHSSPRSFIRLVFQDNGIGIAPQDHARIFSIFTRVHSEKEYEGTGIGLSIVKKAVERMGGSVGLESEVGKGSRFWIELPGA
jgi:signal transduction histidine kinase